ncbi:MAG: DUF4270 domain-containing protein [Flavobacteriales bacterium]|nr:DUF4270 domain-containing protein [Flavobacteriales bacterium]
MDHVKGPVGTVLLRGGLALLIVAITVTACRKPDEDLGLDLLPGDPLGTVVELTDLHAYTLEDTAVRTSGLTRQLLGSYVDPEFGAVKAGFVAQLRLSVNIAANQDNDGLEADSLVLALPFDASVATYGNLDPQVVQVFEVTESLSVDSLYYSDRVPEHDGSVDLVADRGGRITPKPGVRPIIGGDTLVPQLRIRLSQSLAERILGEFGEPGLVDNTAFVEFFKGLYVTVDNGQQVPFEQGVLNLNLLSSGAKATLYYKDLSSPTPDTQLRLDLPINQSSVRYNVVAFDRSQATTPGLAEAIADTAMIAERVYVQAMGGLRTGIRFPDLDSLTHQGKALAKAELLVPIGGTFNPFTGPPTQLFVFRKDEDGKDAFLPDQLAGLGVIDGLYSSADRAYSFNITRYVQGLLNGSIPSGPIELVPGSSGVSVNRAVLAGPAGADGGMRLQLTFTTY